jgi:hypothetical protein
VIDRMSPAEIKSIILTAIQRDLARQSGSTDYGCSAATGAPERAALSGCFDLEELAEAIYAALVGGTQDNKTQEREIT